MLKTFALASLTAAALLLAAPPALAQQIGVVVDAPGDVGPAGEGWVVYSGVPFPPWSGYFLLCNNPLQSGSGDLVPAGEIAEDVHMIQGGTLTSISFAYRVWSQSHGGTGQASGTAQAILNVYSNDPDNTLLPSVDTLLASRTIDLTWEDDVWYVVTYEFPDVVEVPRDLWIGVEIESPEGTAGGLGGKGALEGEDPNPQVGWSQNVTWLGPSACEDTGRLVSNFLEFGITGNYGVEVRVIPAGSCEFPLPNGDFETGVLTPWGALGRTGIVTAADVALGTFSGGWQAALTNGDGSKDAYYLNDPLPAVSGTPASASALESSLGLVAGTLSALVPEGTSVEEGSALWQTFDVQEGDELRFRWNFLSNDQDYLPEFLDFAFLSISPGTAIVLADSASTDLDPSESVHTYETGYQPGEYKFTASGTVTVGFGVVDVGDAEADASLLIDCVELVPGPGGNQPPTCSVDLTLAREKYLEPSPGSFVVTEGTTIVVPFLGEDPDGGTLTVDASGLPADASLSPLTGEGSLTSTFVWTPKAGDKAGAPYDVLVTFRDNAQATSSCSFTIEDVNLRPDCSVQDITVEATGPEGALVTLVGTASDPDGPSGDLTTTWFVADDDVFLDDPSALTATGLFPIGTTDVKLCVVDARHGWSRCTASVTVQPPDVTPPVVACSTDFDVLWPPKHGMQAVKLTVSAAQGQDLLPIAVQVSSSEPDDAEGTGDGATTGDVHGLDGYTAPVDVTTDFTLDPATGLWTGTVLLRAEREGSGVGRKYTFDVSAVDAFGNAGRTSCCVIVPHDRRKSSAP